MTLEIHVHGSPRDGALIACRMLAGAFSRIGRDVTAFVASRGGRGPADVAIVLDPALLAGIARSSLRYGAPIIVNALFAVDDEMPTDTGVLCAACAEAWAETRGLDTRRPAEAQLPLAR